MFSNLTDLTEEQKRRLRDYSVRVGADSPIGDILDTLVGALNTRTSAAQDAADDAQSDVDALQATGGATANGTGVSVVESLGIIRATLTLANVAVPLADNAGVVAYGSLKVLDLPAGAILFLGAVADLDITKSSAGVNDDWDGDISLGSVAANNGATLATTEQDFCPTTPTPQASAGATTGNMKSTSTEAAKVFDGTGTAIDVYLNVLVDDADHDVTGTACNLIFNGTITFSYVKLGDY